MRNKLITIILLGLVGYGGLKLWVFYKAKEDFQQILYCMGMPRVPVSAPQQNDYFQYDRISASIYGPIGVKGMKIRIPGLDEEITFDEILFTFEHDGDIKTCPVPRHINISINEMRMNVSLLDKIEQEQKKLEARGYQKPDQVPAVIRRLGYAGIYERTNDLRALGYDKIVMSISFDLLFNPEEKEATFSVKQSIENFGDLDMMVKVADMAKNIDSAVLGVKIKEAKIEFKDDSYLERILKLYAEENNTSIDALREQVAASVQEEISGKEIKLDKDAVKSLQDFIRKPDRLIVTMYPYKPVGIESIKHYKPGDVPMLLNLQLYTE